MFQPTVPITTRRLILRPYTESDLNALFAIRSRPDVVKYLYQEPATREQVEVALRERIPMTFLEKEGDGIQLAVVLADTDQLLGDVLLRWVSEEHQCGEIGFVFHPDHHGNGYAGEAAVEMLRMGFEDVGLHRIIGRLDAENRASGKLLERLGMRFEARFRENEFVKGRWSDEAVYAMLAGEWRELHDY